MRKRKWSDQYNHLILLVLMHPLAGKIPDSFGNLVNLETLYLYSNQLTGVFKSGPTSTTTSYAYLLLQARFPSLLVV